MQRLPVFTLLLLIFSVSCTDTSRPANEINGPNPIRSTGPQLAQYVSGVGEPTMLPVGQNSRLHSYNAMLGYPSAFTWEVNADGPAFVTQIEYDSEISLYQRGYRLFLGRSRVQGTAADAEPDLLTAIVFEWTDRWELKMAANFSPPDYYVVEELLKPPGKNERQVLFGGLARRRTGNGYHRRLDVFLFNGTLLRPALLELSNDRKVEPLLEGNGKLPPVYEIANNIEHYLVVGQDSTSTILRHLNMGFYETEASELSRESGILVDYLNYRRGEQWSGLKRAYGDLLFGYNGGGAVSRDSVLALDQAFADSLNILHLRSGNKQRSSSQMGYAQRSTLVYAIGRRTVDGRLAAGIWDLGLTVDDKMKIREVRLGLVDSLPTRLFFGGVE